MILKNDLTGLKFERLLVIRKYGSSGGYKRSRVLWECICDCGNVLKVNTTNLKNGNTKSCGCLRNERVSLSRRKHYLRGTQEYKSWVSIKDRCNNPLNKKFNDYGGRGISICNRWANSAIDFVSDMGLKPSPQHSIDRIDVNGNYEPSNCRWATKSDQARNRRDTVMLIIDGIEKSYHDWADYYGIKPQLLRDRIRLGWDAIKAVSTPARKRKNE